MYQFAHMEWAARERTKKRGSTTNGSMKTRAVGWSAQDLADEAERKEGACEHVESPQPPNVVYGVTPSEAAALAKEWGDQAKEAGGKKLRSNSPVISAGVISLPNEMREEWRAYRDTAIEALKERYGDRLRSVVEHQDEANPHIHFYLVPLPGEGFGSVHEGYLARNEERQKGPGAQTRKAYMEAMKGWQDWLYERVSKPFGLSRTGPRRERLGRERYQQEKRIALEIAAAEAARQQAEKILKETEEGKSALEAARQVIAGQIRDMNAEKRELERLSRELTNGERSRLEALQRDMPELKRERDELKQRIKAVTADRDNLAEEKEARDALKKAGVGRGGSFRF